MIAVTCRGLARSVLAAGLAAGVVVSAAQEPAPVSASGPKVKELAALMQARKLESFSAEETGSKYVAAFHIPGVQMLVVSAAYGRPTDMQYRTFHKQHQEIYQELKSSPYASEKFFIEDSLADGLALVPGKNLAADSVTVGTGRQLFDGDFSDPRRKNQKKISRDDYYKAFAAADARYVVLLDLLVAGLKKDAGLAGPVAMR